MPLDIEAAARAELDWWQGRREAATPESDLREAGIFRAEAMAFRDARDGAITDADWTVIKRD